MRMMAKALLKRLFEEGLPPEGWGRWIWRGRRGSYGLSSLVTIGTLPPVEEGEEPLFWWGGVRLADIPYWPEAFLPSPDDGVEPGEEMEYAEKCLVGKLIGEAIKQLPDEDREKFRDALLDLGSPETKLEAEIALNELYL
jgi:hypothetical protein